MECKLATFWENTEKDQVLDVAIGNFTGKAEELVKLEETTRGYKISFWSWNGGNYELVWKQEEFGCKYYNLLVEDINGDNLDELLVVDSGGIKIFRLAENGFSITDSPLETGPNTFLGTVKFGDKGTALVVLQDCKATYYRVGKDTLEELGSEEALKVISYAQTADIDKDGFNEIIIYSEQGQSNELIVYKVIEGSLEEVTREELSCNIKSFSIGKLENKAVLIIVHKNGNIEIARIGEVGIEILGQKQYLDPSVKQLSAKVEMPGLVTLQLEPSVGKIRGLRSYEDKVVVLTEKSRLLVEQLSLKVGERSSRFKPITYLEAKEKSYDFKVNQTLDLEGQIIDLKTSLSSLEERIEKEKINLTGKLNYKYMYRSEENNKLLTGEGIFDFSATIDNPNLAEKDWVQVLARPCKSILKQEEGRYEIETELCFDTRHFKQEDAKFLTGMKPSRYNQFVETTIQVEEPVHRRRTQEVVKGVIEIPQTQDPVEQILETNARVRDLRVQALFNQAVVTGVLEVDVLYVADTPAGDQPVFFIEGEIPFSILISVPGLRPGMNVIVRPEVEFIKAVLLNNRTIEVTAILAFVAQVTAISPIDVIIDVEGNQANGDVIIDIGPINGDAVLGIQTGVSPNQLEVEFPVGVRPVNDVVSRRQNQVLVEEAIDIPPQKPDVEMVLSVNATVEVEEVRVIPDKVIVRGVIRIVIRYVAATLAGDQPVHVVEGEIRFTTFVDLPGIRPGMFVDVMPVLEYVKGRRANERSIDVTAIIKVVATAFRRVRALVQAE